MLRTHRRACLAALTAALLTSCGDERVPVRVEAWPEADELFRHDERWVGGDGALTVDLGGGRLLWLFGDTFITKPGSRSGDDAFFIRNSAALQTGRDPSRAFVDFAWRFDGEAARSFVPEEGSVWLWPGHGARLGDTVLTFWGRICPEGQSGFESCGGWELLAFDQPDSELATWTPRRLTPPAFDPGVDVGSAVVLADGFFYAYGIKGDAHDIHLVRWPVEEIARGDLSGATWWAGDGWSASRASAVLEDGAPEFSVHRVDKLGRWVMIQSVGYGETTLGLRVADRPEGPWSDPQPFYRPPASFNAGAFVYAGKGHTDLEGADIVITYVDGDEYRPRFVRLWFE